MVEVTDGTSHKNPKRMKFKFHCAAAGRNGTKDNVVLQPVTTNEPAQGRLDLNVDVAEQFFVAGKDYVIEIHEARADSAESE